MIRNIRKIGNSQGIIIPRDLLQEIGYPKTVEITSTKDGILIRPIASKAVRRKPRDKDEAEGLYRIMKAELDEDISKGKIKFIGAREIRMDI
jgi:antitoxin component of MazEF toxin-antitoxin module